MHGATVLALSSIPGRRRKIEHLRDVTFRFRASSPYHLTMVHFCRLLSAEIVKDAVNAIYQSELTTLYHADCFEWLESELRRRGGEPWLHAVVTDPPFGVLEFTQAQLDKREAGSGGVWRIPPSFDGHQRSPLPRFTVLLEKEQAEIYDFFSRLGMALLPALHPGAHIIMASNVLLTHIVDTALANAGFEKRATLVRLVQTLRGGDRPKLADKEFSGVSVMPRAGWEPWSVFRKPLLSGERVSTSLRLRGTGALRRPAPDVPFGDVIPSGRTPKRERDLAPHPSLKPQQFMRLVVRAALPLGTGVVYDPFAGGGSTLAAAEALSYCAIGTEVNATFAALAAAAVPRLAALKISPIAGGETATGERPLPIRQAEGSYAEEANAQSACGVTGRRSLEQRGRGATRVRSTMNPYPHGSRVGIGNGGG
jgi:site-specific DNA-methyltransferase (adenine-specific)